MEAARMFDQLKDSLLNSKVVPVDELHSLWRVLEMPFGPQQKTPTRLLKPHRGRERVNRCNNTGGSSYFSILCLLSPLNSAKYLWKRGGSLQEVEVRLHRCIFSLFSPV